MSRAPRIKSKVVRATLNNKDVLSMFQGFIGADDSASASLATTYPKYLRIRTHSSRFLRLLELTLASELMRLFPGPAEHLGAYVNALQLQCTAAFSAPDLSSYIVAATDGGKDDYGQVPPDVATSFAGVFATVKSCNLVNTIIVTCKNLVAFKKSLQTASDLKDRFLTKVAGLTLCPLPDLPQLNFKQIYNDDRLIPTDREFVLTVLHKLYTISHDVYEAVSAPDVDVGEFVDVIMSSISQVRKNIPRCDQAFDKIVESVDLLKGNFTGYYRDYIASSNPTIIMENFVLDVSKNTKSSPVVTTQFKQIIMHYRKLASQQASHPKLQSLFQQVDKNFQELESKSAAADEQPDSDSSSSDSDSDSDESESSAVPTAAPTTKKATAKGSPAKESPAKETIAKGDSTAGQLINSAKSSSRRTRRRTRKAKSAATPVDGLPDHLDDKQADYPACATTPSLDASNKGLAEEFDRLDLAMAAIAAMAPDTAPDALFGSSDPALDAASGCAVAPPDCVAALAHISALGPDPATGPTTEPATGLMTEHTIETTASYLGEH
jgi:hypothetical protein